MKPLDVLAELREPLDVIKIDVEGCEMQVLEGARSTITRFKPKLIIAAYHYPHKSEKIVKYLLGLGFRCFIYQVPLALQKSKETYVYAIPRDNKYERFSK